MPGCKKFLLIASFALAAAAFASALWLAYNAPASVGDHMFKGKTLAAWFDGMNGYTGDPGVQILRDIGPDSIPYLGEQITRKDTFLRAQYVAHWPKLPAFLKSRLKQP